MMLLIPVIFCSPVVWRCSVAIVFATLTQPFHLFIHLINVNIMTSPTNAAQRIQQMRRDMDLRLAAFNAHQNGEQPPPPSPSSTATRASETQLQPLKSRGRVPAALRAIFVHTQANSPLMPSRLREEKKTFDQQLKDWVNQIDNGPERRGVPGAERRLAAEIRIQEAVLWSSSTLDLTNLNLKELPDGIIHLVNMKTLRLNGCDLKELPENFDLLTRLKTVEYDNRSMSKSEFLEHIANSIKEEAEVAA
jgi:hypothetical protein